MMASEMERIKTMGEMLAKMPDVKNASKSIGTDSLAHISQMLPPDDFLIIYDPGGNPIFSHAGDGVMPESVLKNVKLDNSQPGVVAPALIYPQEINLLGRFIMGADGDGALMVGTRSLDNRFVDKVEHAFGVESTLFRGDERVATSIIAEGGKQQTTEDTRRCPP